MTVSQPLTNESVNLDDKTTRVMAYMQEGVAWGEVITKKVIRISTWLRTPMAPQYIVLHHAQVMLLGGGATASHPQSFTQLHVPVSQISGFHIMPPEHDPVDYDVNEPNRILVDAAALVGPFRFAGKFRISLHTDIEHYLDISKETFITLYDVNISQLIQPAKGIVRVPMAIIRREVAIFAV